MTSFLKLSATAVRANLKAHSGFGVFISALLYLVCVTGVIAIFYPELERWEQANIDETVEANPAIIQKAFENIIAWHAQNNPEAKPFEDAWVSLPTPDLPRFSIGGRVDKLEAQFFVNQDGSLGEKVDHEWTHFLVKLHYALTIPGIWGMVLVGVIGVVLTALVISGVLAHPTVFKNAFSLRVNRGYRQQQVDLHNRIGVWSTPFILAISLTGALIGLAQLFLFVFASTSLKSDASKIVNAIFLPHPEPTHVVAPLINTAATLETFSQKHTDLLPYYVGIHFPGTTAQVMEVAVYLPDRLVWHDVFQFNSQGELFNRLGWPDGDVGTQIFASTYRLHFGHYGGLPVKILYAVLGIGMSYLCITGMNIWFRRQQQVGETYPRLERSWAAVVWGFPLAIALTLLVDFFVSTHQVTIFWLTSALFFISVLLLKSRTQTSHSLHVMLTTTLLLIVIAHFLTYEMFALRGAGFFINCLLLIATALLAWGLLIKRRSFTTSKTCCSASSSPTLNK